jgi:transglutaminase-like putative cysteine protease
VRLRVSHQTRFNYSDEIADTAMELRLRPRDGAGQRCLSYDLRIFPPGPVRSYVDSFGNTVETYNQRRAHREIVIEARSLVETSERAGVIVDQPTKGERYQMLRLGGPVEDLPEVRSMTGELAPGGEVSPSAELLADLARLVHDRFVYEPNVTTVDSTVGDLLRLGRGVCQDFAHVWLAMCRVLGVPARYVSGYIWPGELRGSQASHAWGEAWIDGVGWLGYDPTNWTERTGGRIGDQHVAIAVGRDYRDVPPTRGVFRGGAEETLSVDVRVEQVKTDAPQAVAS